MANVIAYTSFDMENPPIRDWNLQGFTATQIVIVDGLNTGTYRGNFTYGGFGSVSGQINSFETSFGGNLQNIVSGLALDASQVLALIQSGHAEDLFALALAGNDSLFGSEFNDVLTGFGGADILKGNRGTDYLYGDAGNDILYGGVGPDHLFGGVGDDVYVYGTGDVIVELAGGANGNDRINSSLSVVMADNIEALSLTGNGNINGTGNSSANRIVGNTGANLLSGAVGDDTILAGAGHDTLSGGTGRDLLYGGTDADGDVFLFTTKSDSAVGATRDSIYNFTKGADFIDLTAIDAVASSVGTNETFLFNGTSAHANSVWYVVSGAGVIVKADVTGDLVSDFEVRVNNVISLSATDFYL